MIACGDGYTNIVQLLLEHDADINLQDKVRSSANIVCECLTLLLCTWQWHNYYSAIIIIVQLKLIARYTSWNSLSVA